MLVDGDEALERLRDPADSRALQPRESDDAIGDDDAFAHEKKLAVPRLRRIRAGVKDDSSLVEQIADRVARLPSEDSKRLILGRHEADGHARDLPAGDPGGGHQRQLVCRQAPDGADRNCEDDGSRLAGLDLGQQLLDSLPVRRSAERDRAVDSRLRHGTTGDEEHRVRNCATCGRVRDVASRIHRGELTFRQCRSDLRRERSQLEVLHRPELEGLGNGHRPVPEVGVRGEQLDGYSVFSERPQRERSLQGGDASPWR